MSGEDGVFAIEKRGNRVTECIRWEFKTTPFHDERDFPSSDEAERYILEQIRNWEDYGFVQVVK